jgi:PAS domain S-box-containing protein
MRLLAQTVASARDCIAINDLEGHLLFANDAFLRTYGYGEEELRGQHVSILHPPDADPAFFANLLASSLEDGWHGEVMNRRKDGTVFSVDSRIAMLATSGGEYAGNVGTVRDITERKRMEEDLRRSHEDLERKVRERTESLAEINAALRVLLNKRDEDKKALEDSMLSNVNGLIMPYLEKLKACRLDERQKIYVDIMEKNFNDLIAPFLRSEFNLLFTPMEIQVANLVRQGKSTKEISGILSICEKTVSFHRDKIRKKIGLKKSKVSLRSHFASGKQNNAGNQ